MSSFSVLNVKPQLTFDDVDGLMMFFTFFPAAIESGSFLGASCVTVDVGGITSLYLNFVRRFVELVYNEVGIRCHVKTSVENILAQNKGKNMQPEMN